MLGYGKIVGSCWLLCEHAHLVDVVGDELATPHVEYLDRLSGSSQGRALSHCVARGLVAVDQVPSSSWQKYISGTVGRVSRRRVMAERYDLMVVGAGPGGSSAAYHSATAGLNTRLIDRQEVPRDKTCGDGLMPHAASEIALMGLADWLDEPHHGKFTGFSIYTHTAYLRQRIPPTLHGPRGYVVRRKETDARLLERATTAGAHFRSGVRAAHLVRTATGRVTSIEATEAGESLRFEAPLVVVADGVGGFAGKGMKAHQNAVARRQYFSGVNGPDRQDLQV